MSAEPEEPVQEEFSAGSESLTAEISGIRTELAGLRTVVLRLHEENEQLRRGQLDRILEPVFRDLLKFVDDWQRRGGQFQAVSEEITDDVGMILERHGVDLVRPEPGDRFDRREHRAVGTVETADPAQDGTVQSTRRPGYRVGTRVLRFPEVYVLAAGPALR